MVSITKKGPYKALDLHDNEKKYVQAGGIVPIKSSTRPIFLLISLIAPRAAATLDSPSRPRMNAQQHTGPGQESPSATKQLFQTDEPGSVPAGLGLVLYVALPGEEACTSGGASGQDGIVNPSQVQNLPAALRQMARKLLEMATQVETKIDDGSASYSTLDDLLDLGLGDQDHHGKRPAEPRDPGVGQPSPNAVDAQGPQRFGQLSTTSHHQATILHQNREQGSTSRNRNRPHRQHGFKQQLQVGPFGVSPFGGDKGYGNTDDLIVKGVLSVIEKGFNKMKQSKHEKTLSNK